MRFLPTNQIWRYWSFDTCLRDIEATGTRDIDLWLCNNHVNIDAHDIYNAKALVDGLRKHRVRVRTLTPEQGLSLIHIYERRADIWALKGFYLEKYLLDALFLA